MAGTGVEKYQIVIEAATDQANKNIQGVNQSLSSIERSAAAAGTKASQSFDHLDYSTKNAHGSAKLLENALGRSSSPK
jgi:hypothetical protein